MDEEPVMHTDTPYPFLPDSPDGYVGAEKQIMENILHNLNIIIIFVPRKRKIGRVIECAGLEIRYTAFWYRGFESLIFRKQTNDYVTRAGRRHNCFSFRFCFFATSHHPTGGCK